MPQLIVTPEPLPEQSPQRRRFTREECRFLTDNGLLDGRWELVDGEIISKMGQKPPHRVAVVLLTAFLTEVFDPLRVQIQLPIDVAPADNSINEPEPDGAVISRPATAYMEGNAPANDVQFVVEIADSSLHLNLTIKMERYARASIPDYWVIDLNERRIVVHRIPISGRYVNVASYGEEETITLLAIPVVIRVADLLPRPAMKKTPSEDFAIQKAS